MGKNKRYSGFVVGKRNLIGGRGKSDLEYVSLEIESGNGRGVHHAEQRSHVIVSAVAKDELLNDAQRFRSTRQTRHHVVCASRSAALPEHT